MWWPHNKKPADQQVLDALRRLRGESCSHEDFVVYGNNRIGCGTCTVCDEERSIDELIMSWKARIERETGAKVAV